MSLNRLVRLDRLYAKLPKLDCKGKCTDSCGPVAMSTLEHKRVVKRTGEPFICGKDLRCSMLGADGRCRVYNIRPLICRLFGLVKKMQCPYGCVPERWVSDEEAHKLFDEIRQLAGDDVHVSTVTEELMRAVMSRPRRCGKTSFLRSITEGIKSATRFLFHGKKEAN